MHNRDSVYINGEWRAPQVKRFIDVINPATGEIIGRAPDCSDADVDAAVKSARFAFDSCTWSARPLAERVVILGKALSLLESRLDDIAPLVTREMGCPITFSKMICSDAVATGRYFLEEAERLPLCEVRQGRQLASVVREPVGVVASICAWNGPFAMAVGKLVPPLAMGCSVIFKPAPETPLDAYFIAEALAQAGLPRGVFNLVTGGRDTGRALVTHAGVDKVSFTGSSAAGSEIGAECGRSFKRMQLELGGKSAAIVAEDADMATTMEGLATGGFFNSGQVCAAFSRVLIPRVRYEEFTEALCATARSFVIGDPMLPGTTLGPLVSVRQRERVERYIARGVEEGATLLAGGRRPPGLDTGAYIEPTVFGDVDNTMTIAREEIFGPVVSVIPYDTLDEAIAIANDSEYGLHGGVFTSSEEVAYEVVSRIRTGTISVNKFAYNTEAPFGGVKCSGVGRDTGREALESYLELKTINITPSMLHFYQA
ncbi:MAG: aldehyde dehydrogenase [Parahaliea sp.]